MTGYYRVWLEPQISTHQYTQNLMNSRKNILIHNKLTLNDCNRNDTNDTYQEREQRTKSAMAVTGQILATQERVASRKR